MPNQEQNLIRIPKRFQNHLCPSVTALVNSAFINGWRGLDTYFSAEPYYFPEYTNHGCRQSKR